MAVLLCFGRLSGLSGRELTQLSSARSGCVFALLERWTVPLFQKQLSARLLLLQSGHCTAVPKCAHRIRNGDHDGTQRGVDGYGFRARRGLAAFDAASLLIFALRQNLLAASNRYH